MLKTNSKKLIEKVNNYIINNVNFDYFEELKEGASLEEIKRAILNEIIETKLKNYSCGGCYVVLNHFYKNSFFEVFKDWARGLPSSFDTCYYYNIKAVDLVGEWLEETEEQKARFNEQQAEDLASYLIFRELTRNIKITDLIKE